MQTAISPNTQVERAYAESRVIRENLRHLATRLAAIDLRLSDSVLECTERFEAHMRTLDETRRRAEVRGGA